MLAAVFTEYGPLSNLALQDVPIPEPGENQVLVQIYAVALNDYELGLLSGKPYIIRLFLGLRRPKINIPGCDFAGRVAKVGAKVTQWKEGDRVYGDLSGGRFGAYAEYCCCSSAQLVAMPDSLTYEAAAGIPQAAVLAMQGFAAGGGLEDGQSILINGAGGGVGYYGIQLARQFQLEVSAVDTAEKAGYLHSLGYRHCYDYQTQDFTRLGKAYDLILDTKTFKSPFAYLRALKPGGTYATVGGSMLRMMQIMLLAPFIKFFTGKYLRMISLQPNWNLEYCNALIEKGELKSTALTVYPFAEFMKALEFYVSAKMQGKVILRMPVLEAQQQAASDQQRPAL